MGIEKIEGIGPAMAAKLKRAGVKTVAGLLKRGGNSKGRDQIAQASGISKEQILKWVNLADLFRVRGIGPQYSELLEAAGVDTVKELAQRNPQNLYKMMVDTNKSRKLVRQTPGLGNVTNWVAQAKQLPRAVSH